MLSLDFHGGRCKFFSELTAAYDDLVNHLDAGRCQLFAQRVAARREFGDQCGGGCGEGFAHGVAVGRDVLHDGRSGIDELLAHVDGPCRELAGDLLAGGGQPFGDLRAALGEAVFQRFRRVFECLANVGALLRQSVDDAAAGFGQHTRDLSGAVLQVARQEIARAFERTGDILGLAFESGRDGGADIRDADLDVVARAGEAVHELDASAGHFLDHPLTRPTERLRDLLAALLQGTGHPVACAADRRRPPARRPRRGPASCAGANP